MTDTGEDWNPEVEPYVPTQTLTERVDQLTMEMLDATAAVAALRDVVYRLRDDVNRLCGIESGGFRRLGPEEFEDLNEG